MLTMGTALRVVTPRRRGRPDDDRVDVRFRIAPDLADAAKEAAWRDRLPLTTWVARLIEAAVTDPAR